MIPYQQFFKNKKVTVLGLGLLGKGLADVQFFSRMGAEIIVTDLKNAEQLAPTLEQLQGYENITYVLGEHRFRDFENRDFILKGQGTPMDSPYIAHARTQAIPIEMDDALFVKLASRHQLIGVTGTRGKTTTTELIFHILKCAGKRVHMGGNIKGLAALPLLEVVQEGDFVVLELSSWQLQGFGEVGISPEVAVFTSFMPDHMNYYHGNIDAYFADKAEIFKHQKPGDVLIVSPNVAPLVSGKTKGNLVIAGQDTVPADWPSSLLGEHNRDNIACAIGVAKHLEIPERMIKKALESFGGVPGRLELIRTYKGVRMYNDTCATTPQAAIAALKALSGSGNIFLIAGGTDKGIDPKPLADAIKTYEAETFLIPGTGTEMLKTILVEHKTHFQEFSDLQDAFAAVMKYAKPSDIVLFSPGFASFGMFANEYDRGGRFNEIVRSFATG